MRARITKYFFIEHERIHAVHLSLCLTGERSIIISRPIICGQIDIQII